MQDILNRTMANQPLPWYKNLKKYYNRDEWELYDLKMDVGELSNLANKPSMKQVRDDLADRLGKWLAATDDPFRCAPHAVLQDKGEYLNDPQCLPLGI